MAFNRGHHGELPFQLRTDVDVVAVPAIGADPKKTWIDEGSTKPWLILELRKHIPNARVLLLDHGKPSSQIDLDSLAHNLLIQILHERQQTSSKRPIFFICHSTGGLVAKAALVIAGHSTSSVESILSSCYGIAFLATPHHGSTYLSAPEYSKSIRRLMQLKYHIPRQIRAIFKPGHPRLLQLSDQFGYISADMKIWTFMETVDSMLTVSDSEKASTVEMHVPITSIISSLLDLEHEKEIPLATDHAGMVCFKGQELTSRMEFIKDLKSSVAMAKKLSNKTDIPLNVDIETMIQVNGFFENTARGISDDAPLKLWSTKALLHEYLANGPWNCLEERIRKRGRISNGSFDDSSVSSLDTRPSSILATSELESYDEISPQEGIAIEAKPDLLKSPMPKDRGSKTRPSPKIHIPDYNAESYFDIHRRESIASVLSSTVHREDPTHEEDITNGKRGTSPGCRSQNDILISISPKYRKLLHMPLIRDPLNENRSEMHRPAPRFDRPEPGSEKLLWIHVPYTHTGWVPPILSRACKDEDRSEFFGKFINEVNWYSNLIRGRHLEPHARFLRPMCIHSRQVNALPTSTKDPQLALYLHWDTYSNLLQRRKAVEQRLRQGRSRPVPDHIAESNLESKLIWKFLGCEPPIHIRRTLDQFGYPNLRSTITRDDDQMLWKRTRNGAHPRDELGKGVPQKVNSDSPKSFMDGKVLMVDQLWLWIVDERTVVTFFPKQEASTAEGKLYEQANLYNSIYSELNGDLARHLETTGDLAALIVLHAVTVLLDRTLHHDLQILRIFEESISILTESTTRSFKRFRSRGFVARPVNFNKTPQGKTMTAAERNERDRRVAEQNREDLTTLLELRDVIDELGTILKLLEQQTTPVRTMARYYEEKGYGKIFIEATLTRLDDYRNQVTEMSENASATQKAVETLLDLKQKQANVNESRLARWQAEITQNQSQAVMIFTIFTVIFLPLSFFTSLFGVNVREWTGVETNPDMSQMLLISFPTSVAIILVALAMAFGEQLRVFISKAQRYISGTSGSSIFSDDE